MREINLDKVACPNCGTSGADNLHADSQINFTGHVDGTGWVACPDCGACADFTEDGEVTDTTGASAFDWATTVTSALDGVALADALGA